MNRKRLSDYGIRVGCMPTGPLDKITDVPGVTVGHATVRDARHHTGVTVIMPCEDNMFAKKLTAASFVLNGFGKTAGLVQVDELGTLETPIALTNTLNVGLVHDALVTVMAERCAADHVAMHSINPVVGECNDSQLNAIVDRPIHEAHVREAIAGACRDFDEGDVGAGAGTVCHGLKGGIGSASRQIEIAGKTYTLGVLVQSNHGCLEELTVCNRPSGRGDHRPAQRAACARTQRPRLDYDGDGDGSARVGSASFGASSSAAPSAGALRLVFRPRQRRCNDRLYDGQPHARGAACTASSPSRCSPSIRLNWPSARLPRRRRRPCSIRSAAPTR